MYKAIFNLFFLFIFLSCSSNTEKSGNKIPNQVSIENYQFKEINTPIDLKAPVITSNQLEIKASPEIVWQVLTNVARWTDWQSSIQTVDAPEMVSEGITFNWKSGGINFTSSIHTMQKEAMLFGWTGKTIGAYAVHNWKLKPVKSGTIVYVEESLSGIFPSLLKRKFQNDLERSMEINLLELKEYCEKYLN
ncbi:hypothetical protein BH23BAC1_BH23BAC1_43520 [soil metagenome]